jgi:hypothetical protein
MSHATKIAIVAAFITAPGGIWNAAAARGKSISPDSLRTGSRLPLPNPWLFRSAPFQYSFVIYPGCIKVVPVRTPYGLERRRVPVCG